MTRGFLVFGLLCLCVFSLTGPGDSCVGRVLNVAVSNSPDQIVMGHMLSILINERTGTTVNVVPSGNLDQCHQAVLDGKAQIYINYVGTDESVIKGVDKSNIQKVYTLVSQHYREKFGMIWLKPFGFDGPLAKNNGNTSGVSSMAAPISTKEVLRKFPVLDRVINKLGRTVNDDTMKELAGKLKGSDAKVVAKDFLKAHKLI